MRMFRFNEARQKPKSLVQLLLTGMKKSFAFLLKMHAQNAEDTSDSAFTGMSGLWSPDTLCLEYPWDHPPVHHMQQTCIKLRCWLQ